VHRATYAEWDVPSRWAGQPAPSSPRVPARPESPPLCLEFVADQLSLPNAPRAGVGLISMRERECELGGTCTIERVLTGGTRVKAQLPLGEPSFVADQQPAADDSLTAVPHADLARPRRGGAL
jgi:hypothetical protein